MPPVPVYAASPINDSSPSHPRGVSPSTAAARYTPVNEPHSVNAGPTTIDAAHSTQKPAQPGAPSVPRPTNAVSSASNGRLEPTPTVPFPAHTTADHDGPPPPQPGAVPSPPVRRAPTISIPQHAGTPPSVAATATATAPQTRHALPSPTPTRSRPVPILAHQHSPSPLHTPVQSLHPLHPAVSTPYPTDLSHPPGYVQDASASFDDKPVECCQSYENRASPSSRRGGILDGEPTIEHLADPESSVLNTAFAWAKAAGHRLSKTEEQIWKTIGGQDPT